jgi:hypothetical protein
MQVIEASSRTACVTTQSWRLVHPEPSPARPGADGELLTYNQFLEDVLKVCVCGFMYGIILTNVVPSSEGCLCDEASTALGAAAGAPQQEASQVLLHGGWAGKAASQPDCMATHRLMPTCRIHCLQVGEALRPWYDRAMAALEVPEEVCVCGPSLYPQRPLVAGRCIPCRFRLVLGVCVRVCLCMHVCVRACVRAAAARAGGGGDTSAGKRALLPAALFLPTHQRAGGGASASATHVHAHTCTHKTTLSDTHQESPASSPPLL